MTTKIEYALLSCRAALTCDARPEVEEEALAVAATAELQAGPEHAALLRRAADAIRDWQAGREGDRQVGPALDGALVALGYDAIYDDDDDDRLPPGGKPQEEAYR